MKRYYTTVNHSSDDDTGSIEMERIDHIENATLLCVCLIVLIILLH